MGNPRDGGAWWAAIYGVIQSRTRLKRFVAAAAAAIFHTSQILSSQGGNTTATSLKTYSDTFRLLKSIEIPYVH